VQTAVASLREGSSERLFIANDHDSTGISKLSSNSERNEIHWQPGEDKQYRELPTPTISESGISTRATYDAERLSAINSRRAVAGSSHRYPDDG
jgi:hypothetical protein